MHPTRIDVAKPELGENRACRLLLVEMLEHTDAAWSSWTIVPTTDHRYARITTFETLIDHVEDALESRGCELPEPWTPEEPQEDPEPEEEAR